MDGLLGIGVPLLIIAGMIITALVIGIRLVRESNQHSGSTKITLRLLGLNMIEPAINTLVIAELFDAFGSRSLWSFGLMEWHDITGALLLTLPMMVLLLPFVWARSLDPVCATINSKLGLLGLLRWLVTAITFIFPYAVLLGLVVLGFSIYWVKRQPTKLIQYQTKRLALGQKA